ncbi:MAG: HNH endonuclease signature motif containing protein [Methanobacteriota archaeon]
MPNKPLKPCSQHGCKKLVTDVYCDAHQIASVRAYDSERGSPSARGYNRRWVNARAVYLHAHPLCEECKKVNRITKAECVDHIIPHQGDAVLFWDSVRNWQALCNRCHSSKTMRETNEAMKQNK